MWRKTEAPVPRELSTNLSTVLKAYWEMTEFIKDTGTRRAVMIEIIRAFFKNHEIK